MSATTEKDVFGVAGWNFVAGDRQIEAILRDLPPRAPLVIRNRLANVLATVAGLVDLPRLRGDRLLDLLLHVPENALVEPALALEADLAPELLHRTLLTRLYHVAIAPASQTASAGSVLLASGYTQAHAAEAELLATWIAAQKDLQVILLAPPGERLADALRPHAQTAWSLQHWGGLDAFMCPAIEEAVGELDPVCVYVAAADPDKLLYTAVGACDYRLRRLQADGLKLDARVAGHSVQALLFAATPVPAGPPRPLRALVLEHLLALGVASTRPDPRFRVTAEAIAIDLV